jgi:hypothetical protein
VKALSRADRDQTALLLRCAAEIALTGGDSFDTYWTAAHLGFDRDEGKRAAALATRVARHVAREIGRNPDSEASCDEYVAIVLEAARRLEEKSWP